MGFVVVRIVNSSAGMERAEMGRGWLTRPPMRSVPRKDQQKVNKRTLREYEAPPDAGKHQQPPVAVDLIMRAGSVAEARIGCGAMIDVGVQGHPGRPQIDIRAECV